MGFTYSGVGDVQALSAFAVTVTSGSPRFTINGMYWNGSSWVVSSGTYAQANDFATINTNIGSLVVASDIVTITAYFTGSNTQGAFSALSLTYTAQQYFTSGRVEPTATIPAQQILSFSASGLTEPTNTNARWVIKVDGVPKYWNGSAWVTSDLSLGQSNSTADINTNAPTLALSSNAEVAPCLLLFTSDQQVTASVASASITYDFGGIVADPNVCIVWGYYKDVTGAAVEGATVTYELVRPARRYFEAASAIIEKKKVVTTDANGYFEAELIRSSEYEPGEKTYKITIVKEADDLDTSRLDADSDLTFEVPDQSNVDITTLLTAGA
ncbi:MAG: hypothetical protein HC883_02080 [Bdellovibrionaceae bacterium]|nr:hypothetical protein [Pseudobdellovibrionaceae bacterium]